MAEVDQQLCKHGVPDDVHCDGCAHEVEKINGRDAQRWRKLCERMRLNRIIVCEVFLDAPDRQLNYEDLTDAIDKETTNGSR